jgi:Uma2 family endonuclease
MTKSSTLTPIIYPDSDGQPMADNTKQFNWIVRIKENLEILFASNPEVFVAGDLLWYPVEGSNTIRRAPDAMVAFGRPKGDRGSYRQWEEGGIAPQVVFEILSPGNRFGELLAKFQFYDRYGVEEYYIYDPDKIELSGWCRQAGELAEIPDMQGWISPRLGIKFDLGEELQIFFPDGQPFLSFLEISQQAEIASQRADEEKQRADEEKHRADSEQQRADGEKQRADEAESRARLMAAKLAELGIDADRLAP